MSKKIPPEILAKLNHTNNEYLRQYRINIKKNPIFFFCKEIYNILKLILIGLISGNNIKKSYIRRSKIDKCWIILLLKQYKEDILLSEGDGRKVPLWNGFRFCVIDIEIAPVVFSLNNNGIITNNACQGDKSKGHSLVPYITTYPKLKIPKELLALLDKHKVPYHFEVKNTSFIGESLHGKSPDTRSDFLMVMNKWAVMNGYKDINKLKNKWKE